MARGPAILPLIRKIIVEEHRAGKSISQIGRDLRLNRQTIHAVIKREMDTGADK